MSSGPPRPFVSVKFTPAGRTYSFLLPEFALDGVGAAGRGVRPGARRAGRSSTRPKGTAHRHGHPQRAGAGRAPRARRPIRRAKVVRRATHEDVVDAAEAPAARAGGAPHLPAEDPRARPGDEADAGRAAVRRLAADLLLHRRRARRLPRAGPRSGGALPDADRDAADRRARRGARCSAATDRAAGRCAARPGCSRSSRCRSRWRSSRT